jgi:cyclopropane-fatty-acyl-phospholipid synthase
MKARIMVEELLASAGIRINGDEPHDIRVNDNKLYSRLLRNAPLELGETYMDGLWDCDSLDEFIYRILSASIDQKVPRDPGSLLLVLKSRLFNLQTRHLSRQVAERHYDLGNDLFQARLDRGMNYSCGYWKNAGNLDEAQEDKLNLVCRKTGLKPGMKVLDLGCGWGSFARYAAEHYDVSVTGYNISAEQVRLARKMCTGLPVEIREKDYREAEGIYDAVVSIGFYEHVGYKNYRTYMEVCNRCLKDTGINLLHTIGGNVSKINTNPWTHKYIFPNGMIPSISQVAKSMEGIFVFEDLENFGSDYDKTLMAWYQRFNDAWPALRNKYGDRFYRMWRYYLLSCAGGFRSRNNQLWQFVMTKSPRKQPRCRI